MINCWYTEITHRWSEEELTDKLILLPERLQQQALRKRQWIDQQLNIGGKLLLLHILKQFKSQLSLSDLNYNVYHRPYFNDGPDFNIAHSGNIVVCCATDRGKIGVDIEQVKEMDLTDYADYFTPNEWDKIKQYSNLYDGFYNYWTRKEAVLKAIGTGFHTPLSSVDVSGESLVYDEITYHIKPIVISQNYKCHIATTLIPTDVRLIPVNL